MYLLYSKCDLGKRCVVKQMIIIWFLYFLLFEFVAYMTFYYFRIINFYKNHRQSHGLCTSAGMSAGTSAGMSAGMSAGTSAGMSAGTSSSLSKS